MDSRLVSIPRSPGAREPVLGSPCLRLNSEWSACAILPRYVLHGSRKGAPYAAMAFESGCVATSAAERACTARWRLISAARYRYVAGCIFHVRNMCSTPFM